MEDFVTYEIAVKLKEKGFNTECHAYYEPLKHCLNLSRVFKTNSLAENYNCIFDTYEAAAIAGIEYVIDNLYKSGVNANNLNKYILWTKTNHESKIVNIYIKIKGSYMRDSNGFPVLNKRGIGLITLDKIIEPGSI